jgi:hypothetical protein
MLRCEQKEGKVFFAFGSKDTSFVHSKAINVQFSITISFTKIIQNASNLYAGRPKK